MRSRLAAPTLAAVAACVAMASPARADQAEAEARAVARRLGQEGVKLFGAGQYAPALEKFNTADHLVPTPTLGLFAARCLVKLGRPVEASERYLEVSRMKLNRSAPVVMRKAIVEAVEEREKLLPTLPTLLIRLEGPRGDGATVLVDDKPVPPAMLGERAPMDPGDHALVARRGDAQVRASVSLVPGDRKEVTLLLPPLPAAPLPPIAKTPTLRYVAWASLGVGVAGVGVGLVSGFVAIGKGSSLLDSCPDHVCADQATLARAGGYDTARSVSTAGFVIGAIGLAAGVPLLLFTPKTVMVPQERQQASRNGTGLRFTSPRATIGPDGGSFAFSF